MGEVLAIRIKERAVQVHPSVIRKVVCYRKPRVLAFLLRDVLLDPPRADGSHYPIGFDASVRECERHEERTVAMFHSRRGPLVFESIMRLKVALNRDRSGLLSHAAVIRACPRSVVAGVTINALPGVDVVSVRVSAARPFVIRLHSGCYGPNDGRDQERDNRRLDYQLFVPCDWFQLELSEPIAIRDFRQTDQILLRASCKEECRG